MDGSHCNPCGASSASQHASSQPSVQCPCRPALPPSLPPRLPWSYHTLEAATSVCPPEKDVPHSPMRFLSSCQAHAHRCPIISPIHDKATSEGVPPSKGPHILTLRVLPMSAMWSMAATQSSTCRWGET